MTNIGINNVKRFLNGVEDCVLQEPVMSKVNPFDEIVKIHNEMSDSNPIKSKTVKYIAEGVYHKMLIVPNSETSVMLGFPSQNEEDDLVLKTYDVKELKALVNCLNEIVDFMENKE